MILSQLHTGLYVDDQEIQSKVAILGFDSTDLEGKSPIPVDFDVISQNLCRVATYVCTNSSSSYCSGLVGWCTCILHGYG